MTGEAKTPVALVVGAGDFLGGAIARRFAREGFHVVATRRRGDLDTLAAAIREAGGEVTALHSDAREEAEVETLFEKIETEIGPLAAVVFNVGGNVRFPIRETTTRVYRKVWEMCALAGFLVGREAARRMGARGAGTIIFTGATASVRGASGFAAFAGGKHALRALAQSMARELGPEGIHVAHVVIDGPIDTATTRELFPAWFEERPEDGVLQPDDLAEVYWQLHQQARSAWTFEIDVRPYVEPW
jgi:NAD(P)-dependent dehydrogenase (short-subunit alcohol dehydrogenase family)